jgi:hypothetical protein
MRDKIVVSSYFITLNSNVSVWQDDNKDKIKSFACGIKRIFLSRNVLNFIKILDKDDKATYDIRDLLNEINSEITFEVGPSNGYLHIHGLVTIFHRSTIKLVTNRFTRYFAKKYGLSIFSMPPRIIPNNSGSLKTYSYKDLSSVPRLSILSRVIPINGKPFVYADYL